MLANIGRRSFGKVGWKVSEVAFGAWQIGGDAWATTDDKESVAALEAYLDAGGNLIDTANVYGSGHSEELIGTVLKRRAAEGKTAERIYVLTKAGRAHGDAAAPLSKQPHGGQNYTYDALLHSVKGSLKRLQVETLDLLQLHCPPVDSLRSGEVFEHLRRLQKERLIEHWGVSIETVDEAHLAIAQPDCASVQIIFNAFRLKPAEQFFDEAKAAGVAVIARVPLASGLLAGRITPEYLKSLSSQDHRTFNRAGAAFDKGETFSGLGEHLEDSAFPAVEAFTKLVPEGASQAQFALRWILAFDAVTTVIPGCRTVKHVEANVTASKLAAPTAVQMAEVQRIYDTYARPHVHDKW